MAIRHDNMRGATVEAIRLNADAKGETPYLPIIPRTEAWKFQAAPFTAFLHKQKGGCEHGKTVVRRQQW